jgi:hypothetical protein
MHRSTASRFLCVSTSKPERAASGAASPQTVTDLVGGLRDDSPDASTPKVSMDRAGRVGAMRTGRVLGLPSPLCGIRMRSRAWVTRRAHTGR